MVAVMSLMTIEDGKRIVQRHAQELGHELDGFRSISGFADRGDTWIRAECINCGMSFDVRWSRETSECWCVARKVNIGDKWAKPMKFGELPLTCKAASNDEAQGVWSFSLAA
jgi:hypothetical protein